MAEGRTFKGRKPYSERIAFSDDELKLLWVLLNNGNVDYVYTKEVDFYEDVLESAKGKIQLLAERRHLNL